MSWWDTPRGLVLGDGPADLAQSTLQDFAARRDREGRPRPTLPELLAAAGAVLGEPGLAARQEAGPDVPAAAGPAPADLVATLRQAFGEIGEEYKTYLDREPKLEEILETVQFILGYRPERYLSGVEGMEILAIDPGT
jgi:hypothetical protein